MVYSALIVEDDSMLRDIYRQVLIASGFEVLQATDGDQALDILSQSVPDLVFLDILLPKIDGFAVLDYIQNTDHLKEVYVIVISAHGRFRKTGQLVFAHEFLLKPVRPSDIKEAAQRAIQRLTSL